MTFENKMKEEQENESSASSNLRQAPGGRTIYQHDLGDDAVESEEEGSKEQIDLAPELG